MNERNEKGDPYGYCTHGSVLFPFWHRPYMAMMEVSWPCFGIIGSILTTSLQQTIYYAMVKIAEKFSDQVRWKAAVEKFRLPYFDWVRPRAKQSGHTVIGIGKDGKTKNPFNYIFDLPRILKEERVMVYLPSLENPDQEKTLKSITNPLYSFSFQNSKSKIPDRQWGELPNRHMPKNQTIRQPSVSQEESDILRVNDVLNKQRESTVVFLLDLFVRETYSDYLRMSNHEKIHGGGSGSIESLHDNIHGYLGGSAHMGAPEVAAFDPVFWLHHCNIDRVMAIWQATHPKRWFPKETPEKKGPDDPLYPLRAFKNGKIDWWTSNDSKDTKVFGYTYADLDPVGAEAIFDKFGKKYVWSIHEESRPDGFDDTPPEDMEPIVVNDSPFFKYEVSKKPAFPGGFNLTSQVKTQPIELQRQLLFKVAADSAEPDNYEPEETKTTEKYATKTTTAPPPNAGTTDLSTTPHKSVPLPEVSDTERAQPEGTKAVRNWYVDSLVPKSAFNGSSTLFYFVTGNNYIRKPYTQEPTLAALNHIFSASVEACPNCARQAEAGDIISDTEAITPILLDIVKNTSVLESIEPEHVVPFLRRNFQVRIIGVSSPW